MKLDETYELYRSTCRRFAQEKIAPHVQAWEEAEEFPRELYQEAAAAGILGVGFPEELGGGGGDFLYGLIGVEELLRGGSSGIVAGPGRLCISPPPRMEIGAPQEQKR
ncbi:MAG TPA: acyl-CoA dehydrogenase family protein, partial [Polyangiaceae bacterium]|nr:acyl-CoA dehydrogenase family protein [Polyangiaceae bacterium]